MATNQEDRQASVRASTGTAYFHNDDWLALFAASSITTGGFNDRMLAWLNATMGTAYQFLGDAQRAFAVSLGVSRWDEIGAFSIIAATEITWSTDEFKWNTDFMTWG